MHKLQSSSRAVLDMRKVKLCEREVLPTTGHYTIEELFSIISRDPPTTTVISNKYFRISNIEQAGPRPLVGIYLENSP